MDTTTISTWTNLFAAEKGQDYFQSLLAFIRNERRAGKIIYPSAADVFNAFKYTPFDTLNVVILGQDPYHGPGQAHGLCFSVQPGICLPPSLKNIFKALNADLNLPAPTHGCLVKWAQQGVLLLNTVLTVEAGKAHSHANKGWEQFTDKVIEEINAKKTGVIFLLWGSAAQRKGAHIDRNKHSVFSAPHPSPLSAYRGFLDCRHFSMTNAQLNHLGKPPINWEI